MAREYTKAELVDQARSYLCTLDNEENYCDGETEREIAMSTIRDFLFYLDIDGEQVEDVVL